MIIIINNLKKKNQLQRWPMAVNQIIEPTHEQ